MSTISDLYYDNLCLANRIFNKKSEEYKLQMQLTDMIEKFSEKLNPENKKEFNKIDDLRTRINSMLEYDCFKTEFKLGIRLFHESFIEDDVPECATFPLR